MDSGIHADALLPPDEDADRPSGRQGVPRRYLDAIVAVSDAVGAASEDVGPVLEMACRQAVEVLGVDHCAFVRFNRDTNSATVDAEWTARLPAKAPMNIADVAVWQELLAGKTRDIENVATDEGSLGPMRELLLGGGIHATLWIPVIGRDDVFGAFSLGTEAPATPLGSAEVSAFQAIAAQVGVAFCNVRLIAESTQHVEQLEALQRTMLAMATAPSTDRLALLHKVIEQAVRLLHAKSGGIYDYFPARGELRLAADYRRPTHVGTVLKVGEGIAGYLVKSGDPHVIVDDYNKSEYRAAIYGRRRIFGAVVEVPLRWQERILGVLYVDDMIGRRFTVQEANVLRLFADQVAMTLGNYELVSRDGDRLERLERLSRASTQIMGGLDGVDLHDRLDHIAKFAAEILDSETCGVFMVRRPGFLSLEASVGHREDMFERGKEFEIRSGDGTGLTGHIAFEGRLFNAHGEALASHFAVNSPRQSHTPNRHCYSLLAIPLKRRTNDGEELVGLLRADNKKEPDGQALPTSRFEREDEWILQIFAEIVVASLESAEWVAQLERQRDQLEALVEELPLATCATDDDGLVIGFNKQAERILGFSKDQAMDLPIESLYVNPLEPKRIKRLLNEQEGMLTDYETRLLTRDGDEVPVRLSACWLYNDHRQRIGSVVYFEDLRSLKDTERRLELSLHASNVVARASNLQDGLEELVSILSDLFTAVFCRVLLVDDQDTEDRDADLLVCKVARLSSDAEVVRLRWNPGIGKQVRLSELPPLDPGVRHDLLQRGKGDDALLDRHGKALELSEPIGSLLVVPLRVGNRLQGLIMLGEMQSPRESQFASSERIDLVTAIAAATTTLIHRMRLLAYTTHREEMLTLLTRALQRMPASKSPDYILNEIARTATELIKGRGAGVWTHHPQLGQLELVALHELKGTISSRSSTSLGLAGEVARSSHIYVEIRNPSIEPDPHHELDLTGTETVVGIQLKADSGDVAAVVLVTLGANRGPVSQLEQEMLGRLAIHASLVLRSARLMLRKNRFLNQIGTLHKITDYIQRVETPHSLLHAVLAGVTASYGLGFNRALVLLPDETEGLLTGAVGIGQLTTEQADAAWDEDDELKLLDFDAYVADVKANGFRPTQVGNLAASITVPLSVDSADLFNHVVLNRRPVRVTSDQIGQVPREFTGPMQVSTPLVIAPLVGRQRVIGLLVADNKFNQAPITDEDEELLMAYAASAAIVLENLWLAQQAELARANLHSFYKVSNKLAEERDPTALARRIVNSLREKDGVVWAGILLLDDQGRIEQQITTDDQFYPPGTTIRAEGVSRRVFENCLPEVFPNLQREDAGVIHPAMLARRVGAAMCLPLTVTGARLGVMWIHYGRPQPISEAEQSALYLYVTQAAIAYETSRQLQQLGRLNAATDALARCTDMDALLSEILTSAKEVLDADAVALWGYDDGTFVPEWAKSSGLDDIWETHRTTVCAHGTSLGRLVIDRADGGHQGASGLWIENANDLDEDNAIDDITLRFLVDAESASLSAFPLQVGTEKLGVLCALYREPRTFSRSLREQALIFVNHVGLALKKSKLLNQLTRTKQAAEAVATVTVVGDRKKTLTEIVRAVKDAAQADVVVLFEYNEQHRTLTSTSLPTIEEIPEVSHLGDGNNALVERVMEEKTLQVVPVQDDEHFRDRTFARTHGIATCVTVPLRVDGRRVGALFVNYRRRRDILTDDKDTIQLFADQAAIALRNRQMFDARIQEWELLSKHSNLLLETFDYESVLIHTVDLAQKLFGVEFANIVLRNNRDGRFVFRKGAGWPKSMEGFVLDPGAGSQTGYTVKVNEPVFVEDFAAEIERNRFVVSPVIAEHHITSSMSVPMSRATLIVGAMLVHSTKARRFTEDDARLLQVIANQAAIALDGAESWERLQRRSMHLKAVHEASKGIRANFAHDEGEMLDQIVQSAVEGIARAGTRPDNAVIIGSLQRYDAETDELIFKSVFPRERLAALDVKIGQRRSLGRGIPLEGRIGITGRTVREGKSRCVGDTRTDRDYLSLNSSSLSELAVPLLLDGAVIGVLNLESDQLDAFDKEDETALEALAENAVIAIHSAKQYRELNDTKSLIQARTALLMVRAGSLSWGHAIFTDAITIGEIANRLGKAARPDQQFDLRWIGNLTATIVNSDKKWPSLPDENVQRVDLCELLRVDLLKQQQAHESGPRHLETIEWTFEPCSQDVFVRLNPDLFLDAVGNVVHNAIKAMSESPRRALSMRVKPHGRFVHVSVTDTGPGIPQSAYKDLFKKWITHPRKNPGSGVGLLIVQLIVEAFGGSIRVAATDSTGTTIVLTVPIDADPAAQGEVM